MVGSALRLTATLDAALAYAGRGWRVIPLKPGDRTPALRDWPELATTDRDTLVAWWTAHPDHDLGIATGEATGVFVLDVDVKDGAGGDETLADLEQAHGALPDTVEAITGTLGRHLFYRHPPGVDLRNSAGRLGPGLDIRANGGYVVAAPTVNPKTGRAYEWNVELHPDDVAVVDAPAWLLKLLEPPPKVDAGPRGTLDGARLAWDRFNYSPDVEPYVALMLADAGWTEGRPDRDGARYFTRPGKAHGIGGTLGKVAPGVFYCFTSSAPPLEAERSYDPADLLALLRFDGDRVACDADLVRQGWGLPSWSITADDVEAWVADRQGDYTPPAPADLPEDDPDAWELTDVDGIVKGGIVVELPTLGRFEQSDTGLFYAGRINAIYGEPGLGKTWVALTVVAEAMRDGQVVGWIDLEEPAPGIIGRLQQLGASPTSANFLHVSPRSSISHARKVGDAFAAARPSVVVIDSTGEALALEGYSPNADEEVATWFARWPRALAELPWHPAVILIDHVVKDEQSRGRWASGSGRKLAALTGAAYTIARGDVELGKGVAGSLRLKVSKDRPGGAPAKRALFCLDAREAVTEWRIAPDGTVEPTAGDKHRALMESVCRYLGNRKGDRATMNDVNRGVEGRNIDKRTAVESLIAEGRVENRGTTGSFDLRLVAEPDLQAPGY